MSWLVIEGRWGVGVSQISQTVRGVGVSETDRTDPGGFEFVTCQSGLFGEVVGVTCRKCCEDLGLSGQSGHDLGLEGQSGLIRRGQCAVDGRIRKDLDLGGR